MRFYPLRTLNINEIVPVENPVTWREYTSPWEPSYLKRIYLSLRTQLPEENIPLLENPVTWREYTSPWEPTVTWREYTSPWEPTVTLFKWDFTSISFYFHTILCCKFWVVLQVFLKSLHGSLKYIFIFHIKTFFQILEITILFIMFIVTV